MNLPTSYTDCLKIIHVSAEEAAAAWPRLHPAESLPPQDAVGRIAANSHVSSHGTPLHDTSAMDGFILDSSVTVDATQTSPVAFRVVGSVVPGQQPPTEAFPEDDHPCLEVMTGGRFPDSNSYLRRLDACVPLEEVSVSVEMGSASNAGQARKLIVVTKPVPPMAHRRIAGLDIPSGMAIVETGQRIMTSHVMPLLSAGLCRVQVVARPRIGIWSTGNEYVCSEPSAAIDVNGPYLTALCRELGTDVEFLGYLDDQREMLSGEIHRAAESGRFDVLITTGAVSAGKFDLVRDALDACEAKILFHGLDIRPGHPALFALLSCRDAQLVPFFGLPGNPGASAVCFRFLALPYLRRLLGRRVEKPTQAKAKTKAVGRMRQEKLGPNLIFVAKRTSDCFVPGRVKTTRRGLNVVHICDKTSPARLEPFIQANCWVHVLANKDVVEGQVVDCYRMSLAID